MNTASKTVVSIARRQALRHFRTANIDDATVILFSVRLKVVECWSRKMHSSAFIRWWKLMT